MALTRNQATMVGCTAPIFWGVSVSLVRLISQTVGVEAGLAFNYLIAAGFAYLVFKLPKFSKLPVKYYILGIGSALVCASSFAFSLALARNGTQAMEVGMINYLWPSLTVVFAVVFNGQKAKWWIVFGMILAIYGIMMILGGKTSIDLLGIFENVKDNPVSYGLALVAAVSWAAYSNFTTAWACGQNPTTLIFVINTFIFFGYWIFGSSKANFSFGGISLVVLTACIMGGAYGLWTYGVQRGNISIMAIASYFTPVLSCVFASILIGASLNHAFWIGVSIVVVGSFICWLAMKLAEPKAGKLRNSPE